MHKFSRRHFFKATAGIGATVSLFLQQKVHAQHRGAIILCSRGEAWGRKVLQPAWDVLAQSNNILDAIETGTNVVELDPDDMSVGYGGLPNEEGVVQLDASIMYGPTHRCGSIACLENIKTPSSVARLVMERTDHIHLVGEGAKRFARMHGFREENLLTDKARIAWLKWKENLSDADDWLPPAEGEYAEERTNGTINVLGISADGAIAGITTTSGLAWKIPGRVGDSPIIGAGLYVDNEVGAAGATGRGEEVIRMCGSFYVVERMRAGLSPQEACEAACQKIIDINGGPAKVNFNDKFIAVNKKGEVGCASIQAANGQEPELSYISQNGFQVVKGRHLLD
ncbi:asparaginase [candidate division KSB1 bacterium]|nr:N(4)-(beta-N-acetylglucosaminyl)-L-asparaginase [candidate division KSB1 bacterium]RQW04170.1 MAG: asparaginase [candidate division KSB1 bacterium]